MSPNLKRPSSPVPCISRRVRCRTGPAADLYAYFDNSSSDTTVFKLEPIDIPGLLLPPFEAGPSGTAALQPSDLAASGSTTTTPASTSTDLPNPSEPLAAQADPESELSSVTAVGPTSAPTKAEAATTEPTIDLAPAPEPAAVLDHVDPHLLDILEADNGGNGARFHAKNSPFCIIEGERDCDGDDDDTWPRLEPRDIVPNDAKSDKTYMHLLAPYKSRVKLLKPMVYRNGYKETTEILGIFESRTFDTREELEKTVADEGLNIKRVRAKKDAPPPEHYPNWKKCGICHCIIRDEDKTLFRHCNSREHTTRLAGVIGVPLPLCGWKCPLCVRSVMRHDLRSKHQQDGCGKKTSKSPPPDWTCNHCSQTVPHGLKSEHKRTCEHKPHKERKRSRKNRRSDLEENAEPANPTYTPPSTHYGGTTEHFAGNANPTQAFYHTPYDFSTLFSMGGHIPDDALPFAGGFPDISGHDDLSVSRPSDYTQPIVGTSLLAALASSSRQNQTELVMRAQGDWSSQCVPVSAYTCYEQEPSGYEYQPEHITYFSHMPQPQPQSQSQPQLQSQPSSSSLLSEHDRSF